MDPVDVWKGSDYDVAFRMAAERRLADLMGKAQADLLEQAKARARG
jgi:hypothetical protein